MAPHRFGKHFSLAERLRAYRSKMFNSETRDVVELVFTGMGIFIVTCIGTMLMICFFFEMERRSSTPQIETPRSPVPLNGFIK